MTRRAAARRAAALGAVCAVALGCAAEAQAQLAAPAPARLQVGAREFRFSLSRVKIKAGKVIIQLVNYGEDDHDLRLKRVGGTILYHLKRTSPGHISELRTTLRKGTFNLWCSLPEHKAKGMRATLRVVKP
ncbi:MAG TPA: hypothetical protein VH306_10850 [Gaiellaceae bacterium]